MAHAHASILERLGETIKCVVCKKQFTDPRMLPCCHTFCFRCLETSLKTSPTSMETEERTYQCPTCVVDFTLPVSAEVPKNVLINQLLDLVNSERIIISRESYCDHCVRSREKISPPALFYCADCLDSRHICDECAEQHRTLRVFRYHMCLDFKDMEKLNRFYNSRVACLCAMHEGEEIGFYCEDCTLALCWKCDIKEHSGHRCDDVQKEADACRNLYSVKDFTIRELFQRTIDKIQNQQDSKWESRESRIQILFRKILDTVAYFKHAVAKHYQTQLKDLENNNKDVKEKLEIAKMRFDMHTNTIQSLVRNMRHPGNYCSIEDQENQDENPDGSLFVQQIIDVWNLDYEMFNTEIFLLLRTGSIIISRMNQDGNN